MISLVSNPRNSVVGIESATLLRDGASGHIFSVAHFLLEVNLPIACAHFAASVSAIFNVIKYLLPN